MKVCIFGLGAIGGHIAVRLSQTNCTVSVIARGAVLDAVRSNGLRLKTADREMVAHPKATSDVEMVGVQDLVVVSVKSTALPAIAASLPALVGPKTAIAFIGNGLPWWYLAGLDVPWTHWSPGVAAILSSMRKHVDMQRAIGMVTYSANHVEQPGTIINSSAKSNSFICAPVHEQTSAQCRHLVRALCDGGAVAHQERDLSVPLWRKLLTNIVTGPLGALTGLTSGEILSSRELRQVVECATRETQELARLYGIGDMPIDPQQTATRLAHHKSSMLQDFESGRPPELATLLGAPCDLARLHGLPTPTLSCLHALATGKAKALGILPIDYR